MTSQDGTSPKSATVSTAGSGGAGSKRQAVIFDADGTLCDVRPVRHYVSNPDGTRAKHANFDKFHAGSAKCPTNPDVADMARAAHAAGLGVVVATGREAKWRELTQHWLDEHQIPYDMLVTRGAKDYRPDSVVKAELLGEIRKQYDPILAVDDRPGILKVWQDADIPTIAVGEDGKLGALTHPPAGLTPAARELIKGSKMNWAPRGGAVAGTDAEPADFSQHG